MFYFITHNIPGYDSKYIETAVRRASIRRHTPLDLYLSNNTSFDRSKFFMGVETNTGITFTRLRGPIDRYFPKVILQFNKGDFTTYRLRLSLATVLIMLFGGLTAITAILSPLVAGNFDVDIVFVALVVFAYYKLTAREIKLANQKVEEAIQQWQALQASIYDTEKPVQ